MKLTLKAARVNAGLSQSEAAKRLGISRFTVLNWEKGFRVPKEADIKKMSEVYGWPADSFIFPPKVCRAQTNR